MNILKNIACAKRMAMIVVGLVAAVAAGARTTTIVVSCDGFRWDYPLFYDTPFLDAMAENGMEGELVPSFPSKTFPNHYTLATGLRPEHHGIIANTFTDQKTGAKFSLSNPVTKYDARYYKGEPIWLTAQRQGKHVAVFYWPGSDVPVQGKYPDVWHNYAEKPHMTFQERVDSVVAYATKADAPDLIMVYFEEPDHNGHVYGPQSKLTRQVVVQMDSLLTSLWDRLVVAGKKDDINLVVVSDHGMTWCTPAGQVRPSDYLKKEWYDEISGSLPANIYAKKSWQQDSIVNALKNANHIRVWRKADIPEYFHYQDDPNIGDVLVLPEEGCLFTDDSCYNYGMHGFDPMYSDMHAVFRAQGRDVKKGIKLGQFSNTAVYSYICHLLGIKPSANDGTEEFARISKLMR